MSEDSPDFVDWEERVVSQERGNRIVHFYLKNGCGDDVLAVVGTERSVRHIIYVVSEQFLEAYGSRISSKICTRWRARREVVDWLTALIPKCPPISPSDTRANEATRTFCSGEPLKDQKMQIPRKLKARNTSEICWSGSAWICSKHLRHYPAFCWNGTTIAVHSFVLITAGGGEYLGYLEDLYEDKRGQKKAKVRWFYKKNEVESVIIQMNPHPREVFITPHVQVISAECIDGAATVLTPKHYEKCLAAVPHLSSTSYMCYRQLKFSNVLPFTLTKLRGYAKQAILSCLDRHKTECLEENAVDMNEVTCGNVKKQCAALNSGQANLKFNILKRPTGIKVVRSQPQYPLSFRVNDEIELLCQDSGIRGCWFRCKILHVCPKHMKVQYEDVQNVDGPGNLEEWVPVSRMASPDKLGVRFPGRLTARPRPIEDSSNNTIVVGALVDAWWSDGWWEGIVCCVGAPKNDGVEVYIPGEKMFLVLHRKHIRISRDWVSNRWINLQPKPELLSSICAAMPSPSTMAKPCNSTATNWGQVKVCSSK